MVSIGSDNDLVLSRRQAITSANDDLFHRRIYASRDELNHCSDVAQVLGVRSPATLFNKCF